jgi:hypothetical protein
MDYLQLFAKLTLFSGLPSVIALIITKITEEKIKSSFEKKLERTETEHSLEIAKFQSELDSLKTKEISSSQNYTSRGLMY